MDRYTIQRELGGGAFGTVYAAHDAESGQSVALKQLSRLSPDALSRFKQEFRAVQGLAHPNIVRLDGLFQHRSGWLIAMELVEGTDLLTYIKQSDNDPIRQEKRLRATFEQLAGALAALHEHGIVHRDLKPANVRVTPEGRVVLLDFGLVMDVDGEVQSTQFGGAGTAAYMAPEQAAGGKVTAAADWYAYGTCLYEALTGEVPFHSNSSLAIMVAKQGKLPPSPSEKVGSRLPQDLEALCMKLLAPAPQDRAGHAEVLATLYQSSSEAPMTGLPPPAFEEAELFEGREQELTELDNVHQMARSEGLRLLLVEGESGIGKSALVGEWVRRLKQREPTALVMRSQCYENEHSAFKAFDAGMEALARRLNRAAGKGAELLLPPHAGLLPRHFPALADAKALDRAVIRDVPAEPLAALRAALFALTELLRLLTGAGSVVLVVDDLQWADAESFRFLRTLSEGPHAPNLLVLATIRPASELDPQTTAELTLLRSRMRVEQLRLGGLSQASCEKLSRSLLAGKHSAAWLDRIAAESKGHPLFVLLISRDAASPYFNTEGELSLEAALAERLTLLEHGPRALLDALALAGVPCSVALLARTLNEPPEAVQTMAASLVSAKLLRRLPHQRLTCFHDQVRGVALSKLDSLARVALHASLAQALSADPKHDKGLLAAHLEGASQLEPALIAHQEAGERALLDLAFGLAQHHYGRALTLAASTGAPRSNVTELRVQRGHALARGGRSALAAQQYLEACEHAEGSLRVELRVWAAQQLLQSAQVEAGLAAARDVLGELGVPLPQGHGAAITRIAWDRLCLGVSGLKLRERREEALSEEQLRLGAMWNLSFPVSWVEQLPGAALGVRHLRLSLAAGERAHTARALAHEAGFATMQRPHAPERPNALLTRARELYDGKQSPALEAWVLFMEGVVASFRLELEAAREKLAAAEALLRARCPAEPWLLTNVRTLLLSAWFTQGELGAHVPELERWIAEADERDDRFAVSSLETLGNGALRFLLRNEPDRVGARVSEVMASWPREPFSFAHFGELAARWYQATYLGGDAALRYLEQERPRHERAFWLKASWGKGPLSVFRAQAALSAYAAAPPGEFAKQCLALARIETRRLRRSQVPLTRLNGPGLEAQLAAIEGDLELALERQRAAAAAAKRLGVGAWEPGLSYFEGLLEGGDAGRVKCAQALTLSAAQGWKNPRRAVAMICPVIDWLEARSR